MPEVKEGEPKPTEAPEPYRHEVNPQEWLGFVDNFSRPGDVMMDTTAGSMGAAVYCALRLGRFLVTIEKDKGGIFQAAVRRNDLIYRFLKTNELLCEVGAVRAAPEWWEQEGIPWQRMAKRDAQVLHNHGTSLDSFHHHPCASLLTDAACCADERTQDPTASQASDRGEDLAPKA